MINPRWFTILLVLTGVHCFADRCFSDEYPRPVDREILVLCQKPETEIQYEPAHLLAEMPLNHLGLTLRYHNIEKELPTLTKDDGIRGILTCYQAGARFDDPIAYLDWCRSAVDMGKKFVILGDPGFLEDKKGLDTPPLAMNRFLRKLGISTSGDWTALTYDIDVIESTEEIIGFERDLNQVFPPFLHMHVANRKATTHLRVRRETDDETECDLIVTSTTGGYAAPDYYLYRQSRVDGSHDVRQWHINPFEFFRRAFDTDSIPKPDTTTIAGRRIYYSHIDGDGWNNLSQIQRYSEKPIISAEVVLREAIIPYPDLPVTVAPIAADLDERWVGKPESIETARRYFALPQIEVGSHTYSHPFHWNWFADYDREKERPFLARYKFGRWDEEDEDNWFAGIGGWTAAAPATLDPNGNYTIPRAYGNHIFDLETEIKGSLDFINALLPEGKKTACFMWSGDTSPFEEAIALSREADVYNINGGDTRFDQDFPSYAWIAPVGRQVGQQRIIYASNSNENTYTELWTDRFYAFKYLTTSLHRTGTPYRVKPCNVYYHLYSGEKEASLSALLHNLDYVRSLQIAPLRTSHFLGVAEGFYTTTIEQLSKDAWRVSNHQRLATIRFDRASLRCVDWKRSEGVIGQTYLHGSLYVYIDDALDGATIALTDNSHYADYPAAPQFYLVQSRWTINHVEHAGDTVTFTARGFGPGEMMWRVPENATYQLKAVKEGEDALFAEVTSDASGLLRITLPEATDSPMQVTLSPRSAV